MKRALKQLVHGLCRWAGYQIVRIPRESARESNADPSNGYTYERIQPGASYAPWRSDTAFLRTFELIQQHTLVDMLRCWELWSLVGQSTKLEGEIVEIGVWRGGTGALIAKKAALCGIPNKVYLCDTFAGVVKAGMHDDCYKGGEHADTSRKSVERLVYEVMNLSNVKILEGVFPDDHASALEKEEKTFRFCHVDVDVYQSAKDVMSWIWKRLVVGGIVVYDDYGFPTCRGITQFVNEQISMDDRLVLYNVNGHAIVIRMA